jgi:hypothetical protein
MLKETTAPVSKSYLEADVSKNTVTLFVVCHFVKPDITSLDGFKYLLLKGFGKFIPPLTGYINALLDPRKISTGCIYKLFEVGMICVEVQATCAPFVCATSSNNLVKYAVDSGE